MKLRQLKKLSKVCVSTALAVAMCLPVGVFAAKNDKNGITAEGETSVKAAITKVLEMGETTTTPNASFTFHFTQKVDADTIDDAAGKTVPLMKDPVAISDVSVDVSGKTGTDKVDGKKVVEVETADFLNGANFTKAGIYVYDVTETPNTYTAQAGETMTYSQAEYRIFVYVANKADNSGVYIKGIGVVPTKNDDGSESADTSSTGKVDPTPNPTPDKNGGKSEGNSKMRFTNTFVKTKGGNGDPTVEDNRSLQISKRVAGDLAVTSDYFNFNVTVKKPVVDKTTTAYKGYIMEGNSVVTDAANVAAENAGLIKQDESGKKYIEFDLSDGGAKTQVVKLKHGQELAFTDAAVGAHFQAVETDVPDKYTASLVVKENNVTVTEGVTATDSGDRIVGETRENSARFTNTVEDVTVTGILMNNLSFVMLILVAVAALGLMVAFKNRRQAA